MARYSDARRESPDGAHMNARVPLSGKACRMLSLCFSVLSLCLLLVLIGIPSHTLGRLMEFGPSTHTHFGASEESLTQALERVTQTRTSEFLRISTVIEARPVTNILRVREEYLLARFSEEMQHGFIRTWEHDAKTHIKVIEAYRQWLPPHRIAEWSPLVDSNSREGLPPPIQFALDLETEAHSSRIKLGNSSQLTFGVYSFRLDYEVSGAITQSEDKSQFGFMLSGLAPLTLPVTTFEASLRIPAHMVGNLPEFDTQLYSLEQTGQEGWSTQNFGISNSLRGRLTADRFATVEERVSKMSGSTGALLIGRWDAPSPITTEEESL